MYDTPRYTTIQQNGASSIAGFYLRCEGPPVRVGGAVIAVFPPPPPLFSRVPTGLDYKAGIPTCLRRFSLCFFSHDCSPVITRRACRVLSLAGSSRVGSRGFTGRFRAG